METNHTPTPWKVVASNAREIEAQDGTYICETTYFPGDGKRDDDPYSNAAFIVRAVNCHEELLDALKTIAYAQGDGHPLALIKVAREALAKAEAK